MFAIMGVTGRVGGAVAHNLLHAGQQVRAIVRESGKGASWAALGCEVKVADLEDAGPLASALSGSEGAFILLPPAYDQAPGLAEGRARAATVRQAVMQARPRKLVVLSSVGAQITRPNLLNELTFLEQALADIDLPMTILRPAWYMENAEMDVKTAREQGIIRSYLQPLDKPLPMVSIKDVGRVAAELLMETWTGHRIVELEGPAPVSPHRIAEVFARWLEKPVQAMAVPRDAWESDFHKGGIANPLPWMQSLDAFNEGWLTFEGKPASLRRGRVMIDESILALLHARNRQTC